MRDIIFKISEKLFVLNAIVRLKIRKFVDKLIRKLLCPILIYYTGNFMLWLR